MPSGPIVKGFDVVGNVFGCERAVLVDVLLDPLLLQTSEERFRNRVVPAISSATHFIVPDEFSPAVVIEAKLTEDDGTARDKVSRVQRLRTFRDQSGLDYEVLACIAGRGFKVRREDMRRLLQATDGKVFTLATVPLLIENTRSDESHSKSR